MKQLQGGVFFGGVAAVLLAAQPVWAAATQVKAVRLSPANGGLNVVLETSRGDRPQIFTSSRGNTLVADIINTQLRLTGGNSFRQNSPAPGIASVEITQLDPNSIRMVVTGTTSTPTSQPVQRTAQGLTLNISSGGARAANSPPASANTPTLVPASPRVAATPPTQTQAQTPTAQRQNVLVPNPRVTIDGVPTPAATPAPAVPPPFLPRAVAPPVGDIAVSNTDASPTNINLETTERVPRLVLRDAPVREVLALLARAAGLNLAFTTAAAAGQQGQIDQAPATPNDEGPRISLDIENESVQDVFNYVLRISGLQANRTGRTIFVSTRLTNQARDVIVRSLRLNQINVGSALNFLVAMGAESAVSRERTVTSVNAVPVGGAATPVTQTQTSTETRVETQRIDFQDSIPLLRGLQVVGDERTNSLTLIGTPKQIDIATAQLIQIDSRRRQVAVNVKIVDVNLLATEDFNTSFSFGIGDSFFSNDRGSAVLNFGGITPPTNANVTGSVINPPVITNPITGQTFLDPNNSIVIPGGGGGIIDENGNFTQTDASFLAPIAPFGANGDPTQPGISQFTPGTPTIRTRNADGTITVTQGTQSTITSALPTLFQFPDRFLARLQAQVVSGNAKILTDPTLTVQEGQTAVVNLTQEVFGGFRLETQNNAGTNVNTVREPIIRQAGLILQIRVDRIDDNGFVALSVAPTVSAIANQVNTADGPITLVSSRQLTSGQIRLRDAQTLILSGIIQETDRASVTKIPILGDIPILGALFRSTNRQNQRQEVIVLLTPQILDDSERSATGYNYTPSPDARQLLERQNLRVPGR